MAYYAARIAAARQGLSANAVTGIVQALMNEQTVAMRSLMERWQAATEKQRTDKPEPVNAESWVTQLWVRRPGGWVQSHFHSVRAAEGSAPNA